MFTSAIDNTQRQLLLFFKGQLGSIDEQCRPARPRADNVQLANQRIVEHMINYIQSDSNDGLPFEAIMFIFETLPRSRALKHILSIASKSFSCSS